MPHQIPMNLIDSFIDRKRDYYDICVETTSKLACCDCWECRYAGNRCQINNTLFYRPIEEKESQCLTRKV